MDINLKSPFFLTQALLPLLEAAASAEDPARIISIGSVDGMNVNRLPNFAYGPSKAAVHHLARTFASHLAGRHITSNAIEDYVTADVVLDPFTVRDRFAKVRNCAHLHVQITLERFRDILADS